MVKIWMCFLKNFESDRFVTYFDVKLVWEFFSSSPFSMLYVGRRTGAAQFSIYVK